VADSAQVEGWFGHVEEVIQRYNIQPQDIWNVDEIGLLMGHSQEEDVAFDRRTGPPPSLASETTWASVIECVNAAGESIKPLVLHRGPGHEEPLDRWWPPSRECPDWYYGFTAKGWAWNEYCYSWLTDVFLPQTRRGSNWRLLTLDGLGSHATGEFQWECLSNQVAIIYLLPHTSHLIQPCDLGPFAHLKHFYSRNLKTFVSQGAEVDRAQFNVLYAQTRQSGMQPQYIQTGWSRSGLYPLNPERILQAPDFERHRQVTPEFAPHRPVTPEIISSPNEYSTPKNRVQFEEIALDIRATLTPTLQHQLDRLRHAYFHESSARICLSVTSQMLKDGRLKRRTVSNNG